MRNNLFAALTALTFFASLAQAAPATCHPLTGEEKSACMADEVTQLRAEASRLAMALAQGRGKDAAFQAQLAALEARVTALGGKVDAGQQDTAARIDAALTALTAFEERLTAAEKRVTRVEERVTQVEDEVDSLVRFGGGAGVTLISYADPRDPALIQVPVFGALGATLGQPPEEKGEWGWEADAAILLGSHSALGSRVTLAPMVGLGDSLALTIPVGVVHWEEGLARAGRVTLKGNAFPLGVGLNGRPGRGDLFLKGGVAVAPNTLTDGVSRVGGLGFTADFGIGWRF